MSVLLGKSLQRNLALSGDNSQEGFDEVDTDLSDGVGQKEYVGLYFSAKWCPPCNAFKPTLIKFYENMKKKDANKLELVFVSSDRDEESFKEYAKVMPWLALPFTDREKKNALSKKYKVRGIPTLVIVNSKTGKMITDKGRENVDEDPEGAEFPWPPQTALEILGDFAEKINGKICGLYFSAHWCPPCRTFTPQLKTKYEELREAGKPLEIIFVSSDKTEEQYDEYKAEMPWIALPFNDPRVKKLNNNFDISGIPSLVILDSDGKVITTEGRCAIMESPIEDFPYKPKALNKVSKRFISSLQELPCLIYFTDSANDLTKGEKAMLSLAQEHHKDCDQDMCFFVGDRNDDLCENLCGYLNINSNCLVITELGSEVVYRHTPPEGWTISEASVREFVGQFNDKKIEATHL